MFSYPIFTRDQIFEADSEHYFPNYIGGDWYAVHGESHPSRKCAKLLLGVPLPRLSDNVTYFVVRRSFREPKAFIKVRRGRMPGHSNITVGRWRIDHYLAIVVRDYCTCSITWADGVISELEAFASQAEATKRAKELAQH